MDYALEDCRRQRQRQAQQHAEQDADGDADRRCDGDGTHSRLSFLGAPRGVGAQSAGLAQDFGQGCPVGVCQRPPPSATARRAAIAQVASGATAVGNSKFLVFPSGLGVAPGWRKSHARRFQPPATRVRKSLVFGTHTC